jgi:CRP-like cAMP-binding protein
MSAPGRPADPPGDSIAERLGAVSGHEDAWTDVALSAGEHLFHAGDPGDAFFVVEHGLLEAYRSDRRGHRMVLERIGPGAVIGELAVLDGGERSAAVVAVEPSRLRGLDRDGFLRLIHASPEAGDAIARILVERLRRTHRYLDMVARWSRQVARGEYEAALSAMAQAADAPEESNLGLFVQTFREMVSAVEARERELRRDLELRMEIDPGRYARQLEEVTTSAFFQDLRERADALRARMRAPHEAEDPGNIPARDG